MNDNAVKESFPNKSFANPPEENYATNKIDAFFFDNVSNIVLFDVKPYGSKKTKVIEII